MINYSTNCELRQRNRHVIRQKAFYVLLCMEIIYLRMIMEFKENHSEAKKPLIEDVGLGVIIRGAEVAMCINMWII